ncbi:hypothetical protein ES707_18981 [subsurface metagenome]
MKDEAIESLRKALKHDQLLERLREVMKEKELSALGASRFIETSPRSVYRWLKYEVRPSLIFRKMIRLGIKRIERLP